MMTNKTMKTKSRAVLVIGLMFLAGGLAGYASYRPEGGGNGSGGVAASNSNGSDEAGRAGVGEEAEAAARRAGHGAREAKPALGKETAGMVRLPAAMAERLAFALMSGDKLYRDTFAMLGFDEGQIDDFQRLMTETLRRCREREKGVAQEFTNSADELVLKIPGDREWGAETQKRAREQIREIAGERALLVEQHLMGELGSETMEFGRSDYYLRLSRQPDGEQIKMLFESLTIREGPEPGASFVDFQQKWNYGSSRRYGWDTTPPPHVALLMEGRDWQRFLKPKP
ncbi:MAG: hypothetical protein JWO82_662 [Akkermansiaceae bacterium]|nr:hypothetical protein [Akkermansiaceae bacterium]